MKKAPNRAAACREHLPEDASFARPSALREGSMALE